MSAEIADPPVVARNLTSSEVADREEAWDAFLAAYRVEPTMGWVHAAYNHAYKAALLSLEGSS